MCTAYYMLTAQSVAVTEEGGKDILDSRGSASGGEHRAIGHLRQLHNLTDQQPVRLLTVLSDSSLL